jgi:CspA family cold shock protein
LRGKIVRLVRDRGFGFIQAENGQEIFFHRTALQNGDFDSLTGSESVEFDMGRDERSGRERAANVRVVST